ncbi:MAG: family 20 glycosylhydrolase [Verrucomicrobiota bacterium]
MGDSSLPPQGFRIEISGNGIRIDAIDEKGAFYAKQLLNQILEETEGGTLPGLLIEDWPDFIQRGYMLDVSRDRVPTMEHLFHLVDYLSLLRYNQLQLYTEHAFAFGQHEKVWKNASPMTAAEIRQLDQYCRDRHIDLVPNQNSFGHMERWLKHEEYKHLAECPEGFEHPISKKWLPQGSVLKPDEQSLCFIEGLYAELLPNFSSRQFNIGGDEPWELGWGASKERVEQEGKHAVYLDFLKELCKLAEQHGVEPMCWADVLLENPESMKQLPDNITSVLWGYEADHPFEEQCAILGKLQRPFYVAPGDSTWSSFLGRHETMLASVRAAAQNGKTHGASGFLMTHWGDNGHPQTWPIALPGMIWAGLQCWNGSRTPAELRQAIQNILQDFDGAYSELLHAVGSFEDLLDIKLTNRSYLASTMLIDRDELLIFNPKPESDHLHAFVERCASTIQRLDKTSPDTNDMNWLVDELTLALEMSRWAATRCLGLDQNESDRIDLIDRYRICWLRRSRPGGLEDSLAKLRGLSS